MTVPAYNPAALVRFIGSPQVDRCQLCGRDADRMVCPACRAEEEARHARNVADMDTAFRAIVRGAKERGVLPDADRRWLVNNGHTDTVKALEQRFAGGEQKRGRR